MFTEWLNMKNFEISVLTANSRYLQTAALEQPQKPADKVRSSWFHDEQMQASVTTIQLDSMTYPSIFAANGNNRATKDKIISYQFSRLVTINSHSSDTFAVGLNLPKNISIVTFLHS